MVMSKASNFAVIRPASKSYFGPKIRYPISMSMILTHSLAISAFIAFYTFRSSGQERSGGAALPDRRRPERSLLLRLPKAVGAQAIHRVPSHVLPHGAQLLA